MTRQILTHKSSTKCDVTVTSAVPFCYGIRWWRHGSVCFLKVQRQSQWHRWEVQHIMSRTCWLDGFRSSEFESQYDIPEVKKKKKKGHHISRLVSLDDDAGSQVISEVKNRTSHWFKKKKKSSPHYDVTKPHTSPRHDFIQIRQRPHTTEIHNVLQSRQANTSSTRHCQWRQPDVATRRRLNNDTRVHTSPQVTSLRVTRRASLNDDTRPSGTDTARRCIVYSTPHVFFCL